MQGTDILHPTSASPDWRLDDERREVPGFTLQAGDTQRQAEVNKGKQHPPLNKQRRIAPASKPPVGCLLPVI